MVNEAVKLITGTGVTLLGRVLVLNALDMSWREIRVRKDPAAVPVTELEEDYEAFCGLPPARGAGTREDSDVPAVGVRELQWLLAERAEGERDFDLLDVREPGEYAIVRIDGSVLMPRAGILSGESVPERSRELYVHCKSGVRSAEVAAFLRDQGYARVFNVTGGILDWVRDIEPEKTVY